jgi:hypothetical protein
VGEKEKRYSFTTLESENFSNLHIHMCQLFSYFLLSGGFCGATVFNLHVLYSCIFVICIS